MTAATFAAVFAALYATHTVGDHWVQTNRQALTKGARGWQGSRACAAHVATLTAAKLAAVLAVALACRVHLSGPWLAAALAVDAVSHYWADRRHALRGLAGRLGKAGFYQLGAPRPGRDDNPSLGTGAYALDQSWHVGWLFVAALIVAAGSG